MQKGTCAGAPSAYTVSHEDDDEDGQQEGEEEHGTGERRVRLDDGGAEEVLGGSDEGGAGGGGEVKKGKTGAGEAPRPRSGYAPDDARHTVPLRVRCSPELAARARALLTDETTLADILEAGVEAMSQRASTTSGGSKTSGLRSTADG